MEYITESLFHTNHLLLWLGRPPQWSLEIFLPLCSNPNSDSMSSGKGARNVCFTLWAANGWTPEDLEGWLATWQVIDLPDCVRYIVAQHEQAPRPDIIEGKDEIAKWDEHEGHHIQGYIEFTKQLTYDKIKLLFECNHVHLEPRHKKSNAQAAAAYCKKNDTYVPGSTRVERGELSSQGRRTDLESYARRIAEGGEAAIRGLADERPDLIVRYHKGFQVLNSIKNPPRFRDQPTVIYLYGKPGCGKSRLAHTLYPNAYSATDKKEGWFDGYQGQEEVIFDDFEGNYPLREMLKIIDFNPLQLPIKGAFTPIRAHTFIFTSNIPFESLYDGNAAWQDRVSKWATRYTEEQIRSMYIKKFGEEPSRKASSKRNKFSDLFSELGHSLLPEEERAQAGPDQLARPALKRSRAATAAELAETEAEL